MSDQIDRDVMKAAMSAFYEWDERHMFSGSSWAFGEDAVRELVNTLRGILAVPPAMSPEEATARRLARGERALTEHALRHPQD